MTGADIQTEIDGINTKIAAEIKTQIDALAAQIQADNAGGTLTQDQINTLIKTETAQLVATTLAAKTADEVKALVEQANIARPSATITINIWTYKGA
jgi:phosphotransferase system HPr-like phosphotransfer protein